MTYNEFLKSKIKLHESRGFKVDRTGFHTSLLPHQIDSVEWACDKGSALIASSFGLGKTRTNAQILIEINRLTNQPVLVVCPLGVKSQFQAEDGPVMGVDFQYIRNREEQHAATSDFHITNYERVRDGDLDLGIYICVALDEGSVLRSLGSDTTQRFIQVFKFTQYKFVFTATPSPNEYLELINYADFLGVMDRGQALTRFFQRDSQKAGNLTLHPHHENDFWLWVSSWALFLDRPSDLGYSDDGYSLPELKVHYHEVQVDQSKYGITKSRDGQVKAFADSAASLQEAAKIKRKSVQDRMNKALVLMNEKPTSHWLLWHLLEDERKAIDQQVPDAVTVYGSQHLDDREQAILDFSHGRIRVLATKPEIAGSGCNFQRHCADAIFMSIDYKFNDFIQAVHRIYRFLQKQEVNIHLIYTEEERPIIDALKEKWELHTRQREKMRGIIRQFGLSQAGAIERLTRSFGCTRQETRGNLFTAINNDCVVELEAMEDNSIGLIHTSIPFGNHYEYSASYNDFGHNDNNKVFWKQMDYLVPVLHRILKPGRNAIIHVKDRIQYATMTGDGCYTIDPFSDECVAAFRKHGFLFIGRRTVVTDVVRENNQTYRLGWSEKCKDASKMGCGLPEYLLLFRKAQTDKSRGYADEPVTRSKSTFTRPKWQLLASSFWRSSGNRLLSPEDLAGMDPDKAYRFIKAWSLNNVYDWNYHLQVGEALEAKKKLPSSYGLLAPATDSEWVWTDINYMHGLNAEQNKAKAEKHICPLPFDIVDRVIDEYSKEGDTVLDPFAGLMTVPLCAIKAGRQGIGIELNPDYWRMGVKYLKQTEYQKEVPSLFDLGEMLK